MTDRIDQPHPRYQPMRLIRWLLIIPAAVVAWYAAFILALVLHAGVDILCPADQVISALCVAPWYEVASNAVVCVGAGLAALLIMLVSTSLAPAYKRQVAVATFVAGAAVAALMGWNAGAFGPMLAAIITGALTLWVLTRRLSAPGAPRMS